MEHKDEVANTPKLYACMITILFLGWRSCISSFFDIRILLLNIYFHPLSYCFKAR